MYSLLLDYSKCLRYKILKWIWEQDTIMTKFYALSHIRNSPYKKQEAKGLNGHPSIIDSTLTPC